MLEIVAIVIFCRHIGRIVKAAGKAPGMWYFLTVVFWFGGEFLGAFAGLVIFQDPDTLVRGRSGIDPMVYAAALIGAVIGIVLLNSIAKRSTRRAREISWAASAAAGPQRIDQHVAE